MHESSDVLDYVMQACFDEPVARKEVYIYIYNTKYIYVEIPRS